MQFRQDIETNDLIAAQANNEINNVSQEQQRLRANLESAEKGGALYKRFAANLSAAEDKIEKSVLQRDAAIAAQNTAQARLLVYLSGL
jgi:exonuclease VII small subunit